MKKTLSNAAPRLSASAMVLTAALASSSGSARAAGLNHQVCGVSAAPFVASAADPRCGLATTPTWKITVVGGGIGVLSVQGRPRYFDALATIGDVNHDGFSDFLVRAVGQNRTLVHYGSSLGPSLTPSWSTSGVGW